MRYAQFEKNRARDGVECSRRLFDSRIHSNAIDAPVWSMRSKRHNVTTPSPTSKISTSNTLRPKFPMRISADLDRSCMLYAPQCTHGMHLRRCEASYMAMRIPGTVRERSHISYQPKILTTHRLRIAQLGVSGTPRHLTRSLGNSGSGCGSSSHPHRARGRDY